MHAGGVYVSRKLPFLVNQRPVRHGAGQDTQDEDYARREILDKRRPGGVALLHSACGADQGEVRQGLSKGEGSCQ